MRLSKKVLSSVMVLFLLFMFIAIPVRAAVELPHVFSSDAANDYGESTALLLKLQDEGVDSATAAKITTVDVTYAVETDYFQPQFIANSDGKWNQFPDEQRLDGTFTYDITGQFKEENTYNEIWIKTGFKNAGAASITSIVFKDASGNVVVEFPGEAGIEAGGELPQTGTAPIGLYFASGFACIVIGVLVKRKRLAND